MTDYSELNAQLEALISGVPHVIADLANASALIWQSLPELNWAGFYLIKNTAGEDKLVLAPFQGKPACIEIGLCRGVCGTAAAENRTVVVKNVHEFPGHIACDCDSNSEIVVPLRRADGTVFGVLDIDSPVFDRFSDEDRAGLEQAAAIISRVLAPLLG